VVLEAFDSRLQRHVALKVLDPDLAGDELARSDSAVKRAPLRRLRMKTLSPCIKSRNGRRSLPYLVMQLIAGESLEQRLTREKTLPLREIVRIECKR